MTTIERKVLDQRIEETYLMPGDVFEGLLLITDALRARTKSIPKAELVEPLLSEAFQYSVDDPCFNDTVSKARAKLKEMGVDVSPQRIISCLQANDEEVRAGESSGIELTQPVDFSVDNIFRKSPLKSAQYLALMIESRLQDIAKTDADLIPGMFYDLWSCKNVFPDPEVLKSTYDTTVKITATPITLREMMADYFEYKKNKIDGIRLKGIDNGVLEAFQDIDPEELVAGCMYLCQSSQVLYALTGNPGQIFVHDCLFRMVINEGEYDEHMLVARLVSQLVKFGIGVTVEDILAAANDEYLDRFPEDRADLVAPKKDNIIILNPSYRQSDKNE